MSVASDLVTVLRNTHSVAVAVPGGIHPLVLPQGCTLPAIRYQVIDDPQEATHDGPTTLEHPRIQLTVHALTHAECERAGQAIKLTLHGQRRIGGASFMANGGIDDYDMELRQYMRHMDVIVWREMERTW